MKRAYWIITIILVAVLARVLFYLNYPAYQTTGDSVTYYLTARSMIEKGVYADQWRTPVYPMMIALPYLLEGKKMPQEFPYMSYEFLWVRIAQSVAGVLSLVILFYLLRSLGVGDSASGWYCLFMACNRTLMAFEHQLLTESFSVLSLLIITYMVVRLTKRFDWRSFYSTSVLMIVVVFLRPSYIALPLVVFAILCWRHRSKFILLASICMLIVYGSVLFIYAETNARLVQYRGISRISDVNLLGKILTLRLQVASAPESQGVKEIIREYMETNEDVNPWSVFRAYPLLYRSEYAKPLGDFVHSVVSANAPTYVYEATKQIPYSLIDISEENDILYTTQRFNTLFKFLDWIYYYSQYINLAVLCAAPWYIMVALRKRNTKNAGYLVISIMILYHIAFAVYLGYADFARHLSVIQPLLYVLSFSFIGNVMIGVRKRI